MSGHGSQKFGVSTELLYEISMDAEIDDLGPTPLGHRRIVRVTGGTFEGPRRRGSVRATRYTSGSGVRS